MNRVRDGVPYNGMAVATEYANLLVERAPSARITLLTTEPFEATEVNGRLYGRGVSDDKGPMLIPIAVVEAFMATRGALPVMVGEEVIGAVGVSGAPGGEKDEACVKAGIDKVAADLK